MSSISRFDHDTIVEPMKARIAELERQAAMKHPFTTAEFRRLEGRIAELEAENKELRSALERVTRTYGSAGAVNIARRALMQEDE